MWWTHSLYLLLVSSAAPCCRHSWGGAWRRGGRQSRVEAWRRCRGRHSRVEALSLLRTLDEVDTQQQRGHRGQQQTAPQILHSCCHCIPFLSKYSQSLDCGLYYIHHMVLNLIKTLLCSKYCRGRHPVNPASQWVSTNLLDGHWHKMIARSLHVQMRNLIITNTKHIMNKNISIFLLQLVDMIPPKSEPLNSFMLFILFLCGFGPSNEKFFIVSVEKNSGNTSNTPAEGRVYLD